MKCEMGYIMNNYFLYLTDLKMRISAEQELIVEDKVSPFLAYQECTSPDWELEIVQTESLPNMKNKGYKTEAACYQYLETENRIFYYKQKDCAPFALTNVYGNGRFKIQYLPQYAHIFTEYSWIFNRVGLELILLQYQRIILHASFIKVGGNGILFSAPSGTGKSTQADLWMRSKNADIINGDRAAIAKTEQGWTAWGIPYAGTSRIFRNEKARISAIVVLKQAKENRICQLKAIQAFTFLYPEVCIHHWDKRFVEQASAILQQMICEVPVFLLECLPEESAVELLYRTLEEGGHFYGS